MFIALAWVTVAHDNPDLYRFSALYSLFVIPYFVLLDTGCVGFVIVSKEPIARKMGAILSCIGAALIADLLLASAGASVFLVSTIAVYSFLALVGAVMQLLSVIK